MDWTCRAGGDDGESRAGLLARRERRGETEASQAGEINDSGRNLHFGNWLLINNNCCKLQVCLYGCWSVKVVDLMILCLPIWRNLHLLYIHCRLFVQLIVQSHFTLATAIFITRIVAYHLPKEWRRSPNYLRTQVTVASEYSRWVPMLLLSPLRCSIFRLQSCTWHCIESKPNRNRIAFFLTLQSWSTRFSALEPISGSAADDSLEARTWEQILASSIEQFPKKTYSQILRDMIGKGNPWGLIQRGVVATKLSHEVNAWIRGALLCFVIYYLHTCHRARLAQFDINIIELWFLPISNALLL